MKKFCKGRTGASASRKAAPQEQRGDHVWDTVNSPFEGDTFLLMEIGKTRKPGRPISLARTSIERRP